MGPPWPSSDTAWSALGDPPTGNRGARRPPRQGPPQQQATWHFLNVSRLHTDGLLSLLSGFVQGLVWGQLVTSRSRIHGRAAPAAWQGSCIQDSGGGRGGGDGAPGKPRKSLSRPDLATRAQETSGAGAAPLGFSRRTKQPLFLAQGRDGLICTQCGENRPEPRHGHPHGWPTAAASGSRSRG